MIWKISFVGKKILIMNFIMRIVFKFMLIMWKFMRRLKLCVGFCVVNVK